jgi:hypothetical protein
LLPLVELASPPTVWEDACRGPPLCPKALVLDEPMPVELLLPVLIVRLLVPKLPLDEPDEPVELFEPLNWAQSEPELARMAKSIANDSFNARHIGFLLMTF